MQRPEIYIFYKLFLEIIEKCFENDILYYKYNKYLENVILYINLINDELKQAYVRLLTKKISDWFIY